MFTYILFAGWLWHSYSAYHYLVPTYYDIIGRKFVGRKWRILSKVTKISPDENFSRQSFAKQDKRNLSKWLVTLLGSLSLQLKTLLLLLGEILSRAKVTNFSLGDENFARRIVSPDENFAWQIFTRKGSRAVVGL